MLQAAIARVYQLLTATWPTGATLLHPDDPATFQAALSSSDVVARYYQPQLIDTGGMATFLCSVDVAAGTVDKATAEAQKLLTTIGSLPARTPTGLLAPRATHVHEDTYERVLITFQALIDTQT